MSLYVLLVSEQVLMEAFEAGMFVWIGQIPVL